MRLQKQLSRKVGNKEYAKYVIVVPPKIIEALEWKDGENLEAEAKENKLVIKRKRQVFKSQNIELCKDLFTKKKHRVMAMTDKIAYDGQNIIAVEIEGIPVRVKK